MTSNTDIMKSLYAAFGRGDIPTVLDGCADDSTWQIAAGPPYGGVTYQGKDKIGGFFAAMGGACEFPKFEPYLFVAEGDHVVTFIDTTIKCKATGKSASLTVVHRWHFEGGKIKSMFESLDNGAAYASIF